MNTSLRRVTKRIPPGKQADVYIDNKVNVALFAPQCVYLDVTFAYPSTSADERVLLEVHEFQRNPSERRRRLVMHHYGAVRRIFAAHPEQLGELLNIEKVSADTSLPSDLEAMLFDDPANPPDSPREFGHEPATRSFRPTVELREALDTTADRDETHRKVIAAYRKLVAFHKGKGNIERLLYLLHKGQTDGVLSRDFIMEHKDELARGHDVGKKAFAEKKYVDAFAAFSLAALINPKHSWNYYYLGRSAHALSDSETARTAFRLAIELNPQFVKTEHQAAKKYYNRGDILYALWEIETVAIARPYVQEIEMATQDLSTLAVLLGDTFSRKNKTEDDRIYAKRAYDAAVVLNPSNSKQIGRDCHTLAVSYTDKDQTSESEYRMAAMLLETAVSLGERNSWTYYRLGRCYKELGDETSANDAFKEVLRRADNNSNVYIWAKNKLTTAQ